MNDTNKMSSKELFAHVANGDAKGQVLVSNAVSNFDPANAENTVETVMMFAGRVQMAKALSSFADVISLQTFKSIKESKSYKKAKGLKAPSGAILTGTWEEFCILAGASRASIDEQLKNLEVFGEEALNSMQTVGFGIRDLRKLRALPEDARKAIVDGDDVKVANKEDAVEIIKELSAEIRELENAKRDDIELYEKKNKEYIDTIVNLKGAKKGADSLIEKKNKEITTLEQSLTAASGGHSIAKTQQLIEQKNKVINELIFEAKSTTQQGIAAFKDAATAMHDGDRPADLYGAYDNAIHEMLETLMQFGRETGLEKTIYDALQGELDPLEFSEE